MMSNRRIGSGGMMEPVHSTRTRGTKSAAASLGLIMLMAISLIVNNYRYTQTPSPLHHFHEELEHQLDDTNAETAAAAATVASKKDGKGLVFLKFHKVSSTTWKNALRNALPSNKSTRPRNFRCRANDPLGHGTVKRYAREGRKGIERCYDKSTTGVVIATVLRDPLDKVMSWVFSKTGGLGYNISKLEIEHLDVLSNINCKQGSMFEYTLTFGHPFIPPSFVNKEHDYMCSEPFEKKFDLAKTIYNDVRIEQRAVEVVTSSSEVDIVMLKERQCENLILLSNFMGGSFQHFCPKLIVHHGLLEKSSKEEKRNSTSQVVLNKLRDMLQIEYSIYNAAVERFNSTMNAIVDANGGNLTALLEQVEKECPKFDCFH